MEAALQWHAVQNAQVPIVVAGSLAAEDGAGGKGVMFVLCDSGGARAAGSQEAPALAQTLAPALAPRIFDEYRARQALAPMLASDPVEVAQWLSAAIVIALGLPADPKDLPTLAVIASVIHQDRLVVARYRGGRIFLLRDGVLQNLIDESFEAAAGASEVEPVFGQLNLLSNDRLFLCTEDVHRVVTDEQVNTTLEKMPSSRRAAQALLDRAATNRPRGTLGVVVADYVAEKTRRRGKPRRRWAPLVATIVGVAALMAAVLLGALALSGTLGGVVHPIATATPAPTATAQPPPPETQSTRVRSRA
jgi:hypothetical protein